MKKLFLPVLLGLSFLMILLPIQNIQAVADEPVEKAPVKTIIVGADDVGNSSQVRVYQKVDQKMNITNRTLPIVANNHLKHWYGQYIKLDGQYWWKIGENQYLKPERISVVNVERNQALGLTIDNYGNFNNKTGVSMINED
ncbi:hypothetical protein [Companilactobacillus sp. FL22-1]|uniref:hypothetical protein n=1 Tax=Companilactobacillus sp. FL22-1 TaxID=3373892 RepID=UPI0037553A17